MKKDLKAIYTKSVKELKDLLIDKRKELFNLKIDNKQNKLKNTRIIFNTRKEIARIMTLIREKELTEKSLTNDQKGLAGEKSTKDNKKQ